MVIVLTPDAPPELGALLITAADVSASQGILAVVSLVLGGGFVKTLSDALKARPEREAVIILPWKELNQALQGQNERLAAELADVRTALTQERVGRREADRQVDDLERYADTLERLLRVAQVDLPERP